MNTEDSDIAKLTLVFKNLQKQLPRVIEIEQNVDEGKPLNEFDIAFLQTVFDEAERIKPLIDKHSEFETVFVKIITLYKHITETALDNEPE